MFLFQDAPLSVWRGDLVKERAGMAKDPISKTITIYQSRGWKEWRYAVENCCSICSIDLFMNTDLMAKQDVLRFWTNSEEYCDVTECFLFCFNFEILTSFHTICDTVCQFYYYFRFEKKNWPWVKMYIIFYERVKSHLINNPDHRLINITTIEKKRYKRLIIL